MDLYLRAKWSTSWQNYVDFDNTSEHDFNEQSKRTFEVQQNKKIYLMSWMNN